MNCPETGNATAVSIKAMGGLGAERCTDREW